jgi:hypothetical protein
MKKYFFVLGGFKIICKGIKLTINHQTRNPYPPFCPEKTHCLPHLSTLQRFCKQQFKALVYRSGL